MLHVHSNFFKKNQKDRTHALSLGIAISCLLKMRRIGEGVVIDLWSLCTFRSKNLAICCPFRGSLATVATINPFFQLQRYALFVQSKRTNEYFFRFRHKNQFFIVLFVCFVILSYLCNQKVDLTRDWFLSYRNRRNDFNHQ